MEIVKLLFSLVLIATAIGSLEANPLKECDQLYEGLLDRIKPVHYFVSMRVSTEDLTYNATTMIRFKVDGYDPKFVEPKNIVILHVDDNLDVITDKSDYLTAPRFSYQHINQSRLMDIEDICRVTEKQLLVIKLAENLGGGSSGILTLTTRALIGQNEKGLQKVIDEETNSVVGAHLKETSVRSAFPCFDDDKFKVSIYLELIHDRQLEVTSSSVPIYERHFRTKQTELVDSIINSQRDIPLSEMSFELRRV